MEAARMLLLYIAWSGLLFCFTTSQENDDEGSSESLPESYNDEAVRKAFNEARQNVQSRETSGQRRASSAEPESESSEVDDASKLHQFFQGSGPGTQQSSTAQKPFEETTRVLQKDHRLTRRQVAGGVAETDLRSVLGKDNDELQRCEALSIAPVCEKDSPYRTIDGSCNNLNHPKWGMTGTCHGRLLDPLYADGVSTIRREIKSGGPLPAAREISLQIHAHMNRPSHCFSHMQMVWGQFLDHDIALTPLNSRRDNNQSRVCCPPGHNDPECLEIQLKDNDPFYSKFGIKCIPNFRSQMCPTCKLGPRQQPNRLTSYIDASQVYGTTSELAKRLRTLDGTGRLISQKNSVAGELLPESDPDNDGGCSFQVKNLKCFQTGDFRSNQHPALTSLHTLFLREHNRLCRKLHKLNPGWNDEKLYQEARKIVVAQMQMITYKEYLPDVIGKKRMKCFDLNIRLKGYTDYNRTIQGNLYNEFTAAAFRFGHSMVNEKFLEMSSKGNSTFLLRKNFNFPFGLYSGQLDKVMLGLCHSPSQKFDRHMVPDVTNHLYQGHKDKTGLDLASLNVLRGRDHGVPPFVAYREFCGGSKVTSFEDLPKIFRKGTAKYFRLYEDVRDIDLFTGGLGEKRCRGGLVGPTFACIIAKQFYNLKYGDRFYVEHRRQKGSFTPAQLAELRKVTLAKIMCENLNIKSIPENVMRMENDKRNARKSCSRLPGMNLKPWKD